MQNQLMNYVRTTPMKVNKSLRRDVVRAISSQDAGKIIPVAVATLLREDRVSRAAYEVRVQMQETPETLMNGIAVVGHAVFVPWAAPERFEGSMDRFNRSYKGEPDKAGGDVVPFFETIAYDASAEFWNTLGIHAKAGSNVNRTYVEGYNILVNHWRKRRSTKLPLRTETDTTLAEAFWQDMPNIVPDFDRALIDGEVSLQLNQQQIPLKSVAVTGNSGTNRFAPGTDVSGAAGAVLDGDGFYDWTGKIWAEMQQEGLALTLSNIELAKKTAAFAAMRKEYANVGDDYLIDLLMSGVRIPDAEMMQPIVLDTQSSVIGYTKRYASDAANLDASVTTGETRLRFKFRTPPMNTGGNIFIVLQIVPEQMFERKQDDMLTTTDPDNLPVFVRDHLDPEKVAIVQNKEIDVEHSAPDGVFGYAPLNHQWNRDFTRVGGKFMRQIGDPFDEDRQRLWAVETVDPALTADFYLVSDLHKKVFADNLAHSFELTTLGEMQIVGNTVFGARLHEDTSDYEELMAQVDTTSVLGA